ncbi:MAG: endonuclease III domain-containing protein [Candidatus Omnitrophica bacterium]|nr:endonuclease III domain-containing protein [Candidatus Omnitrophota bacterium]
MPNAEQSQILTTIFKRLYKHFGPQHWWPGDSDFEIIVGAILTQNTNWGNVEKAIAELKKQGCLQPAKMSALKTRTLAGYIRSAGFFNLKAKRLKNFLQYLYEKYDGRIDRMKTQPVDEIRAELLGVNGIGPETADSIILYVLKKPIFVVDAYTKRFMVRHALAEKDIVYHALQEKFHQLPRDYPLYNEFHALIVQLGK